jgi:hypothetical protein
LLDSVEQRLQRLPLVAGGRVTGLGNQRVEIALTRTPDGRSRLELSRFLTPPTSLIIDFSLRLRR